MVIVEISSSDCKVWNKDQAIIEIGHAMSINDDIILDLKKEGPCFESLGLIEPIYKMRNLYAYQKNITVVTCNLLQPDHPTYDFNICAPCHFVENTKHKLLEADTSKEITKTFGLFIGRSNAPRLDLAGHLWKKHSNKTLMTYHFNIEVDYHQDNIGLDDIVRWQNTTKLFDAVELLEHCPLKFKNVQYPMLMDQHCDIDNFYKNFLIEIVCETYYSGTTFFPTEKIWRPIIMRSPFIVQGSRYFLHKLKDLGFKTFDRWWDEGYSEDPANWQILEIKKIIDYIATVDVVVLRQWYQEMTPILDHNRARLLNLTKQELKSLVKDYS